MDLPFQLTRTIPKEDDDYWRDYRLTPKIFMRYSQGIRFFGSRFGRDTAIRIDAADAQAAGLDQRGLEEFGATAMLHAKAALGLQLLPLRSMQLRAASGTTPFDGLFIALSFFVIVAALMLVALLFRLSIEQRASQWGLLMATGFTNGRVRSLLFRESLLVILFGIGLGMLLGIGYAWLMVTGLKTWWTGAVNGSFSTVPCNAAKLADRCLRGWRYFAADDLVVHAQPESLDAARLDARALGDGTQGHVFS